ncbi:DUF1963 domain-containing protein [Streptomyces sp. NPDC091371]|uniref:DUF1963 domain-containing protein n=1 Tax=Streptomyces sp. NPDC091371 TaxID=3155303 RepID=UPI0034136EEE
MRPATFTTPPRPVAVEELFPELAPLRREAVRLHPRAGAPTRDDSSVGGPLLWPADEPWPVCDEEHWEFESNVRHEAPAPYVPIVQVYRADAPTVPYPEGTDLLQVLWCPYDHEDCAPLPQVRWRDSTAVGAALPAPPADPGAPREYVPRACAVHPEVVTEYPDADLHEDRELYDVLRDRFDRLERETGWDYHYDLSVAPGIKLGGYPGYCQGAWWPECAGCGQRMEHLLTVASWEYDGAWRCWLPVEDAGRTPDEDEVPGLELGGAGGVYVFECRTCPGRPTAHYFDS